MDFIRTYAARIYAVASAVVALVLVYVPGLPDLAILAVVAAVLGLGEAVQKADDAKTAVALASVPDDVEDEHGGMYL